MSEKRKLIINDIIVFAVLIVISFALIFVPLIFKAETQDISLYKDGSFVKKLDLKNDTVYTVPETAYTIEIKDQKAYVISTDCPDKTCEKMHITKEGGSIVCLPNRIVIKLSDEENHENYDLSAG